MLLVFIIGFLLLVCLSLGVKAHKQPVKKKLEHHGHEKIPEGSISISRQELNEDSISLTPSGKEGQDFQNSQSQENQTMIQMNTNQIHQPQTVSTQQNVMLNFLKIFFGTSSRPRSSIL